VALPGTVAGPFSTYFWIPIVASLIGDVIGVSVYDVFIGDVLLAAPGKNHRDVPGRTPVLLTTDSTAPRHRQRAHRPVGSLVCTNADGPSSRFARTGWLIPLPAAVPWIRALPAWDASTAPAVDVSRPS
jgi:hypothetical protein